MVPRKGDSLQKTDPKFWLISSRNTVSSYLRKNRQSWVLILENELISWGLYAMFASVALLARLVFSSSYLRSPNILQRFEQPSI